MTPEIPLQKDMFSGDLVDTRTRRQRQLDRQADLPKQMPMFSNSDTVQFGVSARPWLNGAPRPTLELVSEDLRTPEEIERDLQRAAEQQTASMFGEEQGLNVEQETEPQPQGLLDPETRAKLPPLYSSEEQGFDALAQVKFFTPDAGWTWYASEGSPVDEDGYYDTDKEEVDFVFFGLVVRFEVELDYFALSEFESVHGQLGLSIKRDLDFEPTSLKELMELHKRGLTG